VQSEAYERLVEIMGRMAAGDTAAVFTLYGDYGGHVAALMRRQLRHLGVERVPAAELDGLVIDGCLALLDCAQGWDPRGGALPWTWAGRRLAGLASRWVGQFAVSLDTDPSEGPSVVAADVDELVVLGHLAACHDTCALLREALERVATARDRAIMLEVRVQADAGDPSPASTVAVRRGMNPDAVRQVACRVRSRLRRLAEREDRFAGLADLAIVA
jgi:hypothetical protein